MLTIGIAWVDTWVGAEKRSPLFLTDAFEGSLRPPRVLVPFVDPHLWRERQPMFKARSKLLIMLVLLAAIMPAMWTAAQAHSREGSQKSRSHSSAGVTVSARPGARPASGEPDVPQNKVPPTINGHFIFGDAGDGELDPGGLQGISRFWITRFLGMR